jgi:hypothetical protein
MSAVENYLTEWGIVSNPKSKSAKQILKISPTLEHFSYDKPSNLVEQFWSKYQKTAGKTVPGQVFELVISIVLIREGLIPFYRSAQVSFVPNVLFDFLLYTKNHGPLVLSAKTSLRERYKQADLEGQAIKAVYRRSKSHLITLDTKESEVVSRKIQMGNVLGLDSSIVATSKDFDKLIEDLKGLELMEAPTFPTLQSGTLIH